MAKMTHPSSLRISEESEVAIVRLRHANTDNSGLLPTAKLLKESGRRPTRRMLQEQGIHRIYDKHGKMINLFLAVNDGASFIPTRDGGRVYVSAEPIWIPNRHVKLPRGPLYVDRIASGEYLALDGVVYALFNSGQVCELPVGQFKALDTVAMDPDDDDCVNTAEEPVNTACIPMPD